MYTPFRWLLLQCGNCIWCSNLGIPAGMCCARSCCCFRHSSTAVLSLAAVPHQDQQHPDARDSGGEREDQRAGPAGSAVPGAPCFLLPPTDSTALLLQRQHQLETTSAHRPAAGARNQTSTECKRVQTNDRFTRCETFVCRRSTRRLCAP